MNTQRYWGINVYGETLSDMGHHGYIGFHEVESVIVR